ncbi:hypothetical protein BV22DRAFT_1044983 [Leucogyrophana mollusca]|uniref:Uncharacterized protein n=1 Tax=Leucogyrophana mollusca TaxID=85980 RepID=A0ACB8BQ33_9AGAM|nr:hypothetical protein BV22DRAFT_1044983 [Leucogyrophana mollusca]
MRFCSWRLRCHRPFYHMEDCRYAIDALNVPGTVIDARGFASQDLNYESHRRHGKGTKQGDAKGAPTNTATMYQFEYPRAVKLLERWAQDEAVTVEMPKHADTACALQNQNTAGDGLGVQNKWLGMGSRLMSCGMEMTSSSTNDTGRAPSRLTVRLELPQRVVFNIKAYKGHLNPL